LSLTISIDAMGGDHGPEVVIPAAISALKKHPEVTFILVGDKDTVEYHLQQNGMSDEPRLRVHHASQQVAMDELPSQALRGKKRLVNASGH
jgi:glycerol-3-phosphate acyltransferase PlsX